MMKRLALLSPIVLAVAAACASTSDEVASDTADVVQTLGGCSVETPSTVKAIFDGAKDAFKENVLSGGACPSVGGAAFRLSANSRGTQIPAIVQALEARGCKRLGRSFVSEKAVYQDVKPNGLNPRFVDTIQCGGADDGVEGKIYIAGPESAFHILAFDSVRQAWNYYSTNPGTGGADFVFHGNSFQQAKIEEVATRTGGFPDHPCTTCHTSGGLLLREMRFPWANWEANPNANASRLVNLDNLRSGTASGNASVRVVEDLERDALRSLVATNKTRVAAIKAMIAGQAPQTALNGEANQTSAYTLKSLLTPLFCETEVNIATSMDGIAAPGNLTIPPDLVLSRLLVNRGQGVSLRRQGAASRLDVGGNADLEDFADKSRKLSIPSSTWRATMAGLGTSVPADLQGQSGDGKFPMPIGARAFSDDDFVSRLVDEGILEEQFAAAVLMIDFPNPVFSKIRCDLLKGVPENALTGMGPADITKAVSDSFNAIARSFPGTNEFNANMAVPAGQALAEYATRTDAFFTKCITTLPADAKSLFTLTVQRRAGLFTNPKEPGNDFPKFAVEQFVRDQFFPLSSSVSADMALATALDKDCKVVRR